MIPVPSGEVLARSQRRDHAIRKLSQCFTRGDQLLFDNTAFCIRALPVTYLKKNSPDSALGGYTNMSDDSRRAERNTA